MSKVTVWNPWRMFPREFMDWDEMDYSVDGVEIDVYEKGDDVIARVKAAGYEKDDINIQIESNMITISGRVKEESEEEAKDKKYYRREIRTRSFSRTTDLPAPVDGEKAKAVFKNGMLTITLPKREEAKPKSIEIDVQE